MLKATVIQIRVSPEKKASWQACAEKSGVSLSAWMEAMCDGVGSGGDFAPGWKPTVTPKPDELLSRVRGTKPAPVKAAVKAPVERYVRAHAPNCTCLACTGGK